MEGTPLAREDVAKVAALARLSFSDAELAALTAELAQILGYIEQLQQVETAGIPPLAHAAELTNVFREDDLLPGLPREAALGNAPSRDDECFRVPAVLGD